MTGTAQRTRIGRVVDRKAAASLAAGILLLALGTASVAAASLGGGQGATPFAATFEARTGRVQAASCAALGLDGAKITARYDGTFSVPSRERRLALRLSLEILVDGRSGVGTASGAWRLVDPPEPDIVGKGELVGVVTTVDPPDPDVDPPDPDVDPPDPDLQLRGLLLGQVDPPDPDLPAQRLVGNFFATLTDGGLAISGAVGDGAGDPPIEGELVPAVLTAASPC